MTTLSQILQIRDRLIHIYKRYQRFITPVLKFMIIMSILLMISQTMGYEKSLTKTTTMFILSLMGSLLPPRLMMLGLMLIVSLHAVAGSLEIGGIVFVLFLIIYLMFVRLYPKESVFIIGMLIAYKLNLPYVIPLIAGLFSSLASIVSIGIGTLIWYIMPQLMKMMQTQATDLPDLVEVINANLIILQETIQTDPTMIASIAILSVVLLTVNVIKRQEVDYAEYIAILVGAVMNVIGFLFAIILLKIEVGIFALILSTLISGLIASIAQFFAKVADYTRAEAVEFEDEENYYYVKVIPKIIVNQPKKQIKHIYTKDKIQYTSHEDE